MTAPNVDEFFFREAGPVWSELRGGLWHSTGSHRFRRILVSAKIHPTPDLAPHEFRWAALGTTYTRSIGAVSLFDFAEADWAWLLDDSPKAMPKTQWMTFLASPEGKTAVDEWVSTIWLAVDRSRLPNFMHWKEIQTDWRAGNQARKWMPRIEACHRGALPLSACSHVVIVCAVEPKEFRRMPLHPFDLPELERIEASWRKQFAERYEFRALPGHERQRLWLSKLKTQPGSYKPNPGLEERLRDATRRLEEFNAKSAGETDD